MREVWSLRREGAEGVGRRVRAEIGHWRRRYGVVGIRAPWEGYVKVGFRRRTPPGAEVGLEKRRGGWEASVGLPSL